MSLTDDEIVGHYGTGTLIAELLKPIDTTAQAAVRVQLADLHNAKKIDVLALTDTPQFSGLDPRQSFVVQQIYKDVLPLIDASVADALKTVNRLITLSAHDGMATIPQGAFRKWLAEDIERAKEVVAIGRVDPNIDPQILVDALTLLADVTVVKAFLDIEDYRRRAAIAALGQIDPNNQKAATEVLTILADIARDDANDDMRFTAVFASFGVLQRVKTVAPQWIPRLVNAIAARPSDETRGALLQGLWRNSDLFQSCDVEATLKLGSEGDLASGRLSNGLEIALSHLLGGPHHDLAVDCLTSLLTSPDHGIALSDNTSLGYRLKTLDPARLFALAVRWFTSGDHGLCELMGQLLGGGEKRPPFDTTIAGFGLSASNTVMLCHRAVGHLILAPIVAASIIVAALRADEKAIEQELAQLLLHGILMNFGPIATTYLTAVPKADAAYKPIRRALKLYLTYQKGVEIATPIKELWPSPSQQAAVRQKRYVMGREMMKEAEQQSVLIRLVKRSTILHGRKSISYFGGPERPPMVTEMKTISTSVQIPLLEVIDPVGLQYLMLVFRTSKPK